MSLIKKSLKEVYDNWWLDAISSYKSGSITTDPYLLNPASDQRKGITLIVRPDQQTTDQVMQVITCLYSIEPDQHFYKRNELHMTVLSLFSAMEGYAPSFSELEKYHSAVDSALSRKRRFSIRFEGITASSNSVMIQGFPEDSTLEDIRLSLRRELHERGLTKGLDVRYHIHAAHVTFMRFKNQLLETEKFLEALNSIRKNNFGRMQVDCLDLVINDWYMTTERVELIARFELNL